MRVIYFMHAENILTIYAMKDNESIMLIQYWWVSMIINYVIFLYSLLVPLMIL